MNPSQKVIMRRLRLVSKNELAEFEFNQAQIDSLLNLFEATLSFVPSSTNTKEIADISLAEHSRLTAAFALAIYDYLEDKGRL